MKGKFVKVVSVDIDRDNSILNLTLECGHTLEQKRSKSFLDKEQFQTLLTPQGKPLKAHCNICKITKRAGGKNAKESLESVLSLIESMDVDFWHFLQALGEDFKNATLPQKIEDLCNAKQDITKCRNTIMRQKAIIEDIKERME